MPTQSRFKRFAARHRIRRQISKFGIADLVGSGGVLYIFDDQSIGMAQPHL